MVVTFHLPEKFGPWVLISPSIHAGQVTVAHWPLAKPWFHWVVKAPTPADSPALIEATVWSHAALTAGFEVMATLPPLSYTPFAAWNRMALKTLLAASYHLTFLSGYLAMNCLPTLT